MSEGCCPCITGGASGSKVLVRPLGVQEVGIENARKVELRPEEVLAGFLALKFGGYPALLFKLPYVDIRALKLSLEKALARHPSFAGRMHFDLANNFSGYIALTHAGVPFTVVSSPKKSTPTPMEETSMLSFGDFPKPSQLMSGQAPLMTVKLTTFGDGSAILALCRTHALADGTYIWAFVHDWAAASRGEPLGPVVVPDVEPFKKLSVTTEDELRKISLDLVGVEIIKKPFSFMIVNSLMRTMDCFFLCGFSKTLGRSRLFLSNSDLDKIKRLASPPPGTPGDGWVSTQEALAAHILLSICRAVLPASTTDAATCVKFWLDARRFVGLPKDAATGNGFTVHTVDVERVLQKPLWSVAKTLHDELREEKIATQFQKISKLMSIGGKGLMAELLLEMVKWEKVHPTKGKYDVLLQLNNQSKRVLPDFGHAGGLAPEVLTNAGPSLLLPAPGGVELFLNPDVFSGATASKQEEALRLIVDVDSLTVDTSC